MSNILSFNEFISESVVYGVKTPRKAVKLYDIKWNLNGIPDEELEEVKSKLPERMAFKVDSAFNVVSSVPSKLKKKFGYGVIDFSFSECNIFENLEDLLYCTLKTSSKKPNIFKSNGKLSADGNSLLSRIKYGIRERKRFEEQGTDGFKMTKTLDEIMLGVENIYGIKWDEKTADEIIRMIDDDINMMKSMVYTTKNIDDVNLDEPSDKGDTNLNDVVLDEPDVVE